LFVAPSEAKEEVKSIRGVVIDPNIDEHPLYHWIEQGAEQHERREYRTPIDPSTNGKESYGSNHAGVEDLGVRYWRQLC
jgi:hypothetical protein